MVATSPDFRELDADLPTPRLYLDFANRSSLPDLPNLGLPVTMVIRPLNLSVDSTIRVADFGLDHHLELILRRVCAVPP